jgi:hypothetical protein
MTDIFELPKTFSLTNDEALILSQLSLGEKFSTGGINGVRRQLIHRQNRPIGHISTEWDIPKYILWLQNYCGYGCHPRYCYQMSSMDAAIYQAVKMLLDWQINKDRPTWIGAMEI